MSSLQDVVLAMTVATLEAAKIGHTALVEELVAGGLTEDEATDALNGVIQLRLAPSARRVRVAQLRATGLSLRAIAAQVGADQRTVNRDLHVADAAVAERESAANAAEEEFIYDEHEVTLLNPTVEWLSTAATTLTGRGATTRFWNSLSAEDQRLVRSACLRLTPVLTDLSERDVT